MNSLPFIDFLLFLCVVNAAGHRTKTVLVSSLGPVEKGLRPTVAPPLFSGNTARRILFIAFTPRPVVNKKAGKSAHCTTAIPFALAFKPKESCCFSLYRVWNTAEDHFFLPKLGHFFHAKQARMAQEKRNKKRQLLYKMTIFFLSHMHWLFGEKRQFRFSFDVPPEQTARRRISHLNGADVTEASSSSCFPLKM